MERPLQLQLAVRFVSIAVIEWNAIQFHRCLSDQVQLRRQRSRPCGSSPPYVLQVVVPREANIAHVELEECKPQPDGHAIAV